MSELLRARRYMIAMAIVVAVLLGGLATMNIAMDPLGYARVAGWRPATPDTVQALFQSSGAWPVPHGTREAKLLNVGLYAPSTIFFGSSTVWSYVDAGYPPIQWTDGRRAYNFGLAGATAGEMAAAFEHAVALTPPKRVLVGLEFYMFSADRPPSPGYFDMPFAHRPSYRRDFWQFIGQRVFSSEYTTESAGLLWHAVKKTAAAWLSPSVAAAELQSAPLRTRAQFAELMLSVDKIQIVSLYPDRPFRFAAEDGASTIDAVRTIVDVARRHDIDLRIYLSPSHARSFETIRQLGWWPQFEEWQRRLVAIVDEDARRHPGARPAELWDFCCYNSITTDVVDQQPDGAGFRHFADTIHFKTSVGYMVMDRMFGTEQAKALPADFGVKLSAANVEAHLAGIREAQRQYRERHPEDVQAIVTALQAVGRLTSIP